MELVATLSKLENLERLLVTGVDGIIVGGLFSSRFNYTLDEIKLINAKAKEKGTKVYIMIDAFVFESEKTFLFEYLDEIRKLNVDGIYFADLAILELSKMFDLTDKLIYNPGPIMANSLDAAYYLQSGIDGIVLGRELTIEENLDIIKKNFGKVDMQVFGHLRLSTSKRNFVTNYLKFINKDIDVKGKDTLTLIEEKRDYKLPIKEDEYGTHIYSDFVFECYEEMPYLSKMIKRGILDDEFLPFEMLRSAIRDYQRISEKNCQFLEKSLHHKYSEYTFGPGYFYQKTNIQKDEED